MTGEMENKPERCNEGEPSSMSGLSEWVEIDPKTGRPVDQKKDLPFEPSKRAGDDLTLKGQ